MPTPLDDSYLLTLRALADLERRVMAWRKRKRLYGPAPLYPGRPGLALRRAKISRGEPVCLKTITRHMRALEACGLVRLAIASPGGRPEGKGVANVYVLRGRAWDVLADRLTDEHVQQLAKVAPRRRGRPRGQPATGAAGRRSTQTGHVFPVSHTLYDGASKAKGRRMGAAAAPDSSGAPQLPQSPVWGHHPPPRQKTPPEANTAAREAIRTHAPAFALALDGVFVQPTAGAGAADAGPAPAPAGSRPHVQLRQALAHHAPWLAGRLAQPPDD